MGDLIAVLQHLDLSPVNTLILALIGFVVWKLYQKLSTLEGTDGTLQELRNRLAQHDTSLAVLDTKVKQLIDNNYEGRGSNE